MNGQRSPPPFEALPGWFLFAKATPRLPHQPLIGLRFASQSLPGPCEGRFDGKHDGQEIDGLEIEGRAQPLPRGGWERLPPICKHLLEVFFARECLGQAPMVHLRAWQRSFPSPLSFAEFRTRRFFQAFYQRSGLRFASRDLIITVPCKAAWVGEQARSP